MNAQHAAGLDSVIAADPLASVRIDATAIADLAFGSFSRTVLTGGADRHLALLDTESLELNLNDPAQRQFGDYELLELIGEGGMGVVYRAHQRSLDRDVAVKLLAAGPWASKSFIERFRREAQNAARMQHPNIVAIYEVGSSQELHFFSMRLIRGGSLADLIKAYGKLEPQRAARLLRTIAEAVDYAHKLGVLHLDLKPANVLLDDNGTPHVADFGLARRLEQGLATDNNEVSGTPSYMAPEQCTAGSRKITPATDIWGLGAILYELVTGEPPFLGKSPQETLKLVVEGSLRAPRRYTPELPRDLEAIILQCMAHDVRKRYASARELADDLGRFLAGFEVKARPLNAVQRMARWARREPKLAATALLAFGALVIGVLATTQQRRRADDNAQAATRSANLANERLWQSRADQAATALRDGHNYDALAPLAANIKEREALGLDARDDRIRIATVLDTAPRLIDDIALGSDIAGTAISPDGASIAVTTDPDETLRLIDAATGAERWRTRFTGATHWSWNNTRGRPIRLETLRFSADGRYLIGRERIAVDEAVQPTGVDEVLFDVSDGKLSTPPATVLANFSDATYSDDGRLAIVRNGTQARLARTADWQPLGEPRPLGNTTAWLLPNGGRFVLNIRNEAALWIEEAATFKPLHHVDYPESQRITTWAASPDGATAIIGHRDGLIEHIDLATGKRDALHAHPLGRVAIVNYSSDGRWFGAVFDSGEVLVWDGATFQPLAPPMRLAVDASVHRSQILLDPTSGCVLATSDDQATLWRLRDTPNKPAELLAGAFAQTTIVAYPRAFGLHGGSGLVASNGGQGELRLWRIPPSPTRGLRAPPLALPELDPRVDRVPVVDDNTVRLVDLRDGHPVSPRLQLPQAPAFAALTPDGSWLVASAGPRLFIYDAAKWTLSQTIDLPNDPARIVLHPDSRRAFVVFAEYANGMNNESGRYYDLGSAAQPSARMTLPPYAGLRFSRDGRVLLAWFDATIATIDADTLHTRWTHDVLQDRAAFDDKVLLAENADVTIATNFSVDGTQVDVLVAPEVASANPVWWWRYDTRTGAELGRDRMSETGGGDSFAVLPGRDAIVVRRSARTLYWERGHGARELPNYDAVLALSADGRSVAHGGVSITLTALPGLVWLSPELQTGHIWAANVADFTGQLAFSADGEGLVGRSRRGEWLYWNVAPDARPAEVLEREATLFNPDRTQVKHSMSVPLAEAERRALRATDNGPQADTPLPAPQIPKRQPEADSLEFNLSAYYDAPTQNPVAATFFEINFPEFAPGLHRFHGVDYDARGVVNLPPYPGRLAGIHPPLPRFAALHLLVAARTLLKDNKPEPYAIVELTYGDGSRERLPLMYLRDVNEFWTHRQDRRDNAAVHARIAWRAREYGSPNPAVDGLYTVRLTNPHADRDVTSIAFEAVAAPWSRPSFFAITAEPVSAGNATTSAP
jgi:WD40 repeat protein